MRKRILDSLYFKYIKCLCNNRKKRRKNERYVVLVAECMTPRVQKIGYGLKKKGMKVILFIQDSGEQKLNRRKHLSYFDEWHYFRDKRTLLMLCMRFKPLAYHVFVGARVPDWAVFLVKNKRSIGKIVYDQYDIYRDMYTEENTRIIESEKFCLENADGIVCRSFQTQYLKKTYGYKFKGKRLLFFDYCWNEDIPPKRKKSAGEKLCIVYAGRLLSKKDVGLLNKIEWKGVLQWVQSAQMADAKFIIIPANDINSVEYNAHFRLANRNSSFVLKECMDIRNLFLYEKEMDYGTDSFELYSDQKCNMPCFNFEKRVQYASSNKYFDYIDAGIPIITGRPTELLSRYLKRYGVIVDCILEDLPQKMDWLKLHRSDYIKPVQEARKVLNIENQIGRLIEFYKRG